MAEIIYDVKSLLKDLEALQPGMRRQLIAEVKAVAKPLVSNIKMAIPDTAPLSGMSPTNNKGRLAWGAGVLNKKGNAVSRAADSVTVKFRSSRSRYTAVTPLVSLWVTSPMTAIADTAGKGNFRKSKTVTGVYPYKGGSRKHRINGQGQAMVRNLKSRYASDFVYPAVEATLPRTQSQIKLVINRYERMVNRKLS